VLVRPGRDLLVGVVEVDETFIGGEEPRPGPGQEIAGRHRGGGPGTEGYRPVQDGDFAGRVGCRAAPIHHRPHRAGRPRHHRRVAGLSRAGHPSATRTNGAASAPPAPVARIPASCCPPCTGSPRWPSSGCWAPTRAQWTRRTWPARVAARCLVRDERSPSLTLVGAEPDPDRARSGG
jgi:hypothetical protein